MALRAREISAISTLVAFMALLPAVCPCPPQSAKESTEHACCVPPVGVSHTDSDCCGGESVRHEAAPAPAAPDTAMMPPGTSVRLAPVSPMAALAPKAATLTASPPLLVLRI